MGVTSQSKISRESKKLQFYQLIAVFALVYGVIGEKTWYIDMMHVVVTHFEEIDISFYMYMNHLRSKNT